MKLTIVLVVALSSCLFFLSAQTSIALALSLSPSHCGEASMDACVDIGEQTHEAIHVNAIDFMRFAGTFTNTMVNVSGQITIEITINDDNTIEGTVDFSQFSAGQQSCGSGDFEGTKTGERIELNFTSNSANPACGFNQGVTFTIEAALLNNTIIRGNYSTDTGQEGIVGLRRIFTEVGLYVPFIKR
jgi:hypothetical protein